MVKPSDIDYPDTTYVQDIDDRVFQSIVMQCLAGIGGVSLAEGTLLDSLLGRAGGDRLRAVSVQQEAKAHSVSVKVEVSIAYGMSIPDKCEEIQREVSEAITRLTGLHVSCVHVVVKGVLPASEEAPSLDDLPEPV